MGNRLLRFQTAPTVVLGFALLWVPGPAHAQSTATQSTATQDRPAQDRQASQNNDEITRRDLARFDQFLDSHREDAEQLRKTPSLIDDPQYLQNHPQLNAYLQDHPSVKEEITQRPDTFMRLEDQYNHDRDLRDRDANWQDRDANGQDRDRDANSQDRDRDPGARDRDADRRELGDFDRFLDSHREVGEQIRKDPSLANNREFVQSHPALQDFLRDNPGVREQLRQDPNAFMRQEDRLDHAGNGGDHGDMHEHMADFGGFLGGHSDINRDLSKDPSVVKDHAYLENHAELNDYLNAHPGVRDDLNANPQGFVKGAQQFGTNGTSTNGSASGTTAPPAPKPKQ
jgi:hypothetical protein